MRRRDDGRLEKDRGRGACYRAERFLDAAPRISREAFEALCQEVWRERRPLAKPLIIRFEAPRKRTVARALASGVIEVFGDEGLDAPTALHEVAHLLTPHAGHGAAWRAAYAALLDERLGAGTGARFLAGIKQRRFELHEQVEGHWYFRDWQVLREAAPDDRWRGRVYAWMKACGGPARVNDRVFRVVSADSAAAKEVS